MKKEKRRADSSITDKEVMEKLFGEYEGKLNRKTFTDELFLILQDTFEGEIVEFSDSILIKFLNGKTFRIAVSEMKD